MKVIIAGGRYYDFTPRDISILDELHDKYKFTKVLSGGCSRIIAITDNLGQKTRKRVGADYCGEQWAKSRDIPVHRFTADWSKYGKKAGMIRNGTMSVHADMLIAFPGGRGTSDMIRKAESKSLIVYTVRDGTLFTIAEEGI